MKRIILVAIVTFVILLPSVFTVPSSGHNQGKALILSSIQGNSHMGYANVITDYLANAGYEVTFLNDTAVTINLLTTQLNNYDVVIWRTDNYQRAHTVYWFVGEISNQKTLQNYQSDFRSGWIDDTYGILGVSLDFLRTHFTTESLANVKLAILVSSVSAGIAEVFVRAGVKSAVDYFGNFSHSFSMTDYVTRLVVEYLAKGYTVNDAIVNTVTRFLTIRHDSPLDAGYVPPVWYLGDGTVTIA